MPINFPDAPSSGDTHTVGDKTWTWDGTAWNVVTSSGSDHGNLGGLADDDHTQYALADGTRGTFEASGAVSTHEAASDPHTQYLLADGTRTATELTVSGDLTVDTSTLHVDSTNNRVGIGTATPGYPLDVVGDVNVSQSITSEGLTVQGSATVASDMTVDTNTLHVDSTNNRVGIGTTTPDSLLEIKSSRSELKISSSEVDPLTNHSGRILFENTNISDTYDAAAIEIHGGSDAARNGSITFLTNPNGTSTPNGLLERMIIDELGNVGIGTTSPTASLTVTSGTDDAKVKIDSNGGSVGIIDATANTNDATNRWLSINPSGGNVGIGTTAPSATLDVNGTLEVSGNISIGQKLTLSNAYTTGSAKIALYETASDTYGLGISPGDLDYFSDGDHRWYTQSGGGSSGNERMVIDSSGRVGIGTTSPAYNLHVPGTVYLGDSTIGGFTNADADEWPKFEWLRDTTGAVNWDDGLIKGSSSRGVFGRAHFGIHFHQDRSFAFHTSGWDTEMEIRGDGMIYMKGPVGINTASPSYRLDVNGPEDTASRVNISSGNTAYRYHMRFSRNNSLLANGIFSDTGATYFGNASDVNLKTGISDLSKQDALAAVSSLRPVEYRYLLDTEDVVRKGFIAQEMVEVIPEAVHRVGGGHPATSLIYDENGDLVATDTDENGDPIIQQEPDWMLTWEPITTTLVAAVQAQQELIQELTARIEALESAP